MKKQHWNPKTSLLVFIVISIICFLREAVSDDGHLSLDATNEKQVNASRISVQFESYDAAKKAADKLGAKLVYFKNISLQKGFFNGYFELKQRAKALTSLNATIAKVQKSPGVIWASYDSIAKLSVVPNDARYGEQWSLPKIAAPEAWDLYTDASDVVVAVIDSGIEYNHEDLAANVWVNPNEIAGNGVDDDGNGFIDDIHGIDTINGDADPLDDLGHGSHTAGTIGAVGNNGLGVAGVCWKVQLLSCKAFDAYGSGSMSAAAACMDYVVGLKNAGINIVLTSNSYGDSGGDKVIKTAIEAAGAVNILAVFSAGNNGADLETQTSYPVTWDLEMVVAVMGTDSADAMPLWTNYGQVKVDLAAPGAAILSCELKINKWYAVHDGTSMAAPHVSGALALAISYTGGMDMYKLKTALLASVDKVAGLSGKCASGGRLNVRKLLDSLEPGPDTDTDTDSDSDSDSDSNSDSDSDTDTDADTDTDGDSDYTDSGCAACQTAGKHSFGGRLSSLIALFF